MKTDATPVQIAEKLLLSSVSVERMEKFGSNDLIYDVEITTNRPDLMSVMGVAREAAAVLQQNNLRAQFVPLAMEDPKSFHKYPKDKRASTEAPITIVNDSTLVNRICAVVMDITLKRSPQYMKDRLEATDIRSLNNIIDVTNYVMRVTGHPTHVFDYDRIHTGKLLIREAKQGECITTLDTKAYSLRGGEIIADDGTGRVVDLLGVMGLENSVVTDETKRILFFIDTVEPVHIRKASMTLGIRTEAAIINEKGVDPELAAQALQLGIQLYRELADGKIVSDIVDIYPNKPKAAAIRVTEEKITEVIGIHIPLQKAVQILKNLGFEATIDTHDHTTLTVIPPTIRTRDVQIPEDVIEEIARIYGYQNIPDVLPPLTHVAYTHIEKNEFSWEDRMRDALKYWGFTEVYTYPMISQELAGQVPTNPTVAIANPLSEEFVYMRQSLIPSLLKVVNDNNEREQIKIFEIGNVYEAKINDLPRQSLHLTGLMKLKETKSALENIKGIIESLCDDLAIHVGFKQGTEGRIIIETLDQPALLGEILVMEKGIVAWILNIEQVLKRASLKKTYMPLSKYPPIKEDLALIVPEGVTIGNTIALIKRVDPLLAKVEFFEKYKETKTFHIEYQSYERNLTDQEVAKIRVKILAILKQKLNIRLKE